MKSHPRAAVVFQVAARSRTLEGLRELLVVACPRRGHLLAQVVQTNEGRLFIGKTRAHRAEAEIPRAIQELERLVGRRTLPRTEHKVIVDLIDDDGQHPTLRAECGCGRYVLPRPWLLSVCPSGGEKRRRVAAPDS